MEHLQGRIVLPCADLNGMGSLSACWQREPRELCAPHRSVLVKVVAFCMMAGYQEELAVDVQTITLISRS